MNTHIDAILLSVDITYSQTWTKVNKTKEKLTIFCEKSRQTIRK